MGTFVKFKKSRWHRLYEKGEMTKPEALDAWYKAREAHYLSIGIPTGGPYLTRTMVVTRPHDPGYVITFKVPK